MSFNWNISSRRLLVIGAVLMFGLCATLLATPRSAFARATQAQQVTTSCHGGSTSFSVQNPQGFVFGTTTSRCRDINIIFTNLHPLELVCVIFIRHTSGCNATTVIIENDFSWHVIATDVLDGTAFEVSIGSPGNVGSLVGFLAA